MYIGIDWRQAKHDVCFPDEADAPNYRLTSLIARSTTFSTVNPSFLAITWYGAEAPKRSRLSTSPCSVTYLCQPCATAATC